jgi:hypothetical protein
MNRMCLAGVLTATLAFSGRMFSQELTREDPFPETAGQSQFSVFDTSKTLTLTGTISQEISRPASNASYLFFRVSVNRTIWTIQIRDLQLRNLVAGCSLCLTDDYTPEMGRLKAGTTVTVKGYETKRHDRRLLLVPESGPNTIAGMRVTGVGN